MAEERLKNGIAEKKYYELLEWKDKNGYAFGKYADFIAALRGERKSVLSLHELTQQELTLLCEHTRFKQT